MPDGRITKYIPGRGNIIVGFKALTATVNFTYSPITGTCPVTNSQLKNAKEQLPINICECIIPIAIRSIIDGGNVFSSGQIIIDGGIPSGSGPNIINGGYP